MENLNDYTQTVAERTVRCAKCEGLMVLPFDLDNDDREPGTWWHGTGDCVPQEVQVDVTPTNEEMRAFIEAALWGMRYLGGG